MMTLTGGKDTLITPQALAAPRVANVIKLFSSDYIKAFEYYSEFEIFCAIKQLDNAYFNTDDSLVDDNTYDAIIRQARILYPLNSYFIGVGSAIREADAVKLPFLMGSLDQLYEDDVIEWLTKIGVDLNDPAGTIITDKEDGNSALIIYDETGNLVMAYSRGDGIEGRDITRHILKMNSVPKKIEQGPLAVRTEVIISKDKFENRVKNVFKRSGGQPYKNPRNFISGLLNASSNNDDVYQYISVLAYSVYNHDHISKEEQLLLLKRLGFAVVPYLKVAGGKLNAAYLTELIELRKKVSPFELDGVVVDVNNANIRSKHPLTADDLNPEYSRKYKISDTSNYAETEVVYVEWNLSKDGYFKPRVHFKAVELVGATVEYASGFNAKFIVDNGIGPGAIISIVRSGDVIPYITKVITKAEPELPSDDFVWNNTNVDIILADKSNNKTVILEQLVDFFTTLDVPKLKDGNLASFVELGFKTPDDIIDLTQEDIVEIVGSKPIGNAIFVGIRDKLNNIPLYKLMGAHPAMGRGIGVRKMKKLWEAFSGDMTKCQDFDSVVSVEGFDTKTATKIVAGYPDFMAFFKRIENKVKLQAYVAPTVGALTGKSFVFTEFRSAALEEKIVSAGGKMSSSVSKNTSYVVTTNTEGTTGKLNKARDLNIPIITPSHVEAMIHEI